MAKNLGNNNNEEMEWEDDFDNINLDDLDLDDLLFEDDEDLLEDNNEVVEEEVEENEEPEEVEDEIEELDEVEEEDEEEEIEEPAKKEVKKVTKTKAEPKAKTKEKVEPKKEVKKETKKETKAAPKAKTKEKVEPKKEVKKETKKKQVVVDVYPEKRKAKKTTNTTQAPTYQEMLDTIKTEKVDKYKEKMQQIKNGVRTVVPNNKRIGKLEFARLLKVKMAESEEMSDILLTIFKRSLDLTSSQRKALKLSPEQEATFRERAKFNLAQTEKLVKNIFIDAIYDLIKIESGIDLISEDDCNFSFSGVLQEEKTYHNSKLIASSRDLTDCVTIVGEHYKVDVTSRAPEGVKTKGKLIDGEFIPDPVER